MATENKSDNEPISSRPRLEEETEKRVNQIIRNEYNLNPETLGFDAQLNLLLRMVDGGPAAQGDEALDSNNCSVIENGTSMYVCVTDFGKKLHGIKKGDTLTVRTFPDRIEIEPK